MPGVGLIILAAGGSTRMGRPKQLLAWGKSSLLRHACETALESKCSPVIVVLGCEAEKCRSVVKDLSVTVAINDDWGKGLGSSIAVGIKTLEALFPEIDGALIMLADQPTVTPALLRSLIEEWSRKEHSIVATSYGGEGGVPALFARCFFQELRLLEQDCGAKAVIAREKEQTALVNPVGNLIDLDTLEAYREYKVP